MQSQLTMCGPGVGREVKLVPLPWRLLDTLHRKALRHIHSHASSPLVRGAERNAGPGLRQSWDTHLWAHHGSDRNTPSIGARAITALIMLIYQVPMEGGLNQPPILLNKLAKRQQASQG